jgi:hypothetical protein
MNKNVILFGVVVLLICVVFSGCQENNSVKLQITNHTIIEAGGLGLRVEGTVKNVGDKSVDSAEVTVKFYDKDDELLATKTQQLQDIAKGATADFSIYYFWNEKNFDQYDHYNVSVSPI